MKNFPNGAPSPSRPDYLPAARAWQPSCPQPEQTSLLHWHRPARIRIPAGRVVIPILLIVNPVVRLVKSFSPNGFLLTERREPYLFSPESGAVILAALSALSAGGSQQSTTEALNCGKASAAPTAGHLLAEHSLLRAGEVLSAEHMDQPAIVATWTSVAPSMPALPRH
jgi:hypothetical protein